jgi:hypothetical protein
MRQIFIVIISFLIANLMASCVSNPIQHTPSEPDQLVFKIETGSNEQATDQLVKFLNDNAFNVKRIGETELRVDYGGGKFLMQPKVSENGLDRIVVSKLFGVKEQYRNTIEILAFVVKLNQKLNVGQFSLSNNSDTMIILANVTFVNKLEMVEIRKFMHFFNNSVKAIVSTVPDTVKYLE